MDKYSSKDFKKSIEKSTHSSTRRFLTLSILLLGAFLVIGTILDMGAFTIFKEYEEIVHKFISVIFYSCIGLLCIIIGLERVLDITRIDQTLNKQTDILQSIDSHISQYRQYKFIENYNDIYNSSLQLIESTTTNIRSVVYANSPKAPDSWNEKVASILKAKSDAGTPVQFDIVICINPEDINEQFIESSERRFQLYKDKGADMYFHRYIQNMERTIGLDCIIIDDKSLIVSFPTILSNTTQKALLFENQPDTIKQFINWFNSYAMFEALSYKTIVKNFMNTKIIKNT
ncbi:MAG TPA: hypothetical protein VK590_14155 [Saprospiraceae bacterium]|nr:hypothetical protein [Saprospiraceae bacterium]